mmetsp:Transcript_11279/g.15608  ORF Transcript_11279/g.15608 Transcript_11279/m.15608 type:complete len:331 (-) Transcript_11279:80-1072(-)
MQNNNKLIVMCTFTTLLFLAEIVVGYMVSSLALISDSFHMLSDLIALIIALVAMKMKERQRTDSMTYGWVRAETLGGLINGILLFSLCINIIIEAIQRFVEPVHITDPLLLLIVASAGLAFNIIGLLVFSGHAHSGHSHGHSHGHAPVSDSTLQVEQKETSSTMHSVFLHVLGDALGSVAVIASSLFIWLTDFSWRFYVDPLLSILLSVVLLRSSFRLIKQTSMVILHRVPSGIDTKKIREEILKVSGVVNIHELHVWQLDDERYISTLHVAVNDEKWMEIGYQVKQILHRYGVHNTTIQPEFVEEETSEQCALLCKEASCRKRICCEDN